jgi:hypothetical protein
MNIPLVVEQFTHPGVMGAMANDTTLICACTAIGGRGVAGRRLSELLTAPRAAAETALRNSQLGSGTITA